jgi:ABC-type nitrate/sulfonate/bicarbonate transport system ATPase subunit
MEPYTYGKTLVTLKDVHLSFGNTVVLRGVSGEIKEIDRPSGKGQVYSILGPSGVGKTQLFRTIAGLQKPTSGMVSLNGFNTPVKAGDVGVVAQNYPLFRLRTVMSNLMLAACMHQEEKSASAMIKEYLDLFKLYDKRNSYPYELSGGQRQRIAAIQHIVRGVPFLLMDEPFSGQDLISLDKLADAISKVASLRSENVIVLITHDITTAAAVSDHLWLLGHELDAQGNQIAGARIIKEYNLIDRDLCWHPGIITTEPFMDFVREVKTEFRKL